MNVAIAAGGTGGHIFPALAVALEFRRRRADVNLLWIGSSRNREQELCEKHAISIRIVNVKGIKRQMSAESVSALFSFAHEVGEMNSLLKQKCFDAVIAFGGYVSAPVLAAARMRSVPYYLQEQNTVPGLVNRFFARSAACTFLGFPLSEKRQLKGTVRLTGTPVRPIAAAYDDSVYPDGFDRKVKGVLICGGSQGAASMNRCLIGPIRRILEQGTRVVWQTGAASYEQIAGAFASYANAFIYETLRDVYPFYATSKVVVCRAGASTLSEVAYFGLPCVMIPLPWASENHQWSNAGMVEGQGWGIRIAQSEGCGEAVVDSTLEILGDSAVYERMCRMALDHSPVNAAADIVTSVLEKVN